MRPVIAADLMCAGRALLAVPPGRRRSLAHDLIRRARTADHHRANTGVSHPEMGDGTLASAARIEGLAPEPDVSDVQFAAALICVLEAVIAAVRPKDRHPR